MRSIALVLTLSITSAAAAAPRTIGAVPAATAASGERRPTPIADAAARAAQAPAARGERRGPSFEWHLATAALLIGGAAVIVTGAKAQDPCYAYREWDECGGFRRPYYVAGGVLLGAGGTLLVLGERKGRRPRTSVDVSDGRLTLQHRLAF